MEAVEFDRFHGETRFFETGRKSMIRDSFVGPIYVLSCFFKKSKQSNQNDEKKKLSETLEGSGSQQTYLSNNFVTVEYRELEDYFLNIQDIFFEIPLPIIRERKLRLIYADPEKIQNHFKVSFEELEPYRSFCAITPCGEKLNPLFLCFSKKDHAPGAELHLHRMFDDRVCRDFSEERLLNYLHDSLSQAGYIR